MNSGLIGGSALKYGFQTVRSRPIQDKIGTIVARLAEEEFASAVGVEVHGIYEVEPGLYVEVAIGGSACE